MPEYTSKIIKGGALLEESRRLVDVWDDSMPVKENLDDFRIRNLLGKRSLKRAEDALAIVRQRLVDPGAGVITALRALSIEAEAFRDGCYYEATRNDDLLAHVAEVVLSDMRRQGWVKVTVEDVETAMLTDHRLRSVTTWGCSTRRRVVHGALSALRDFGVLEGRAIKHIASPRISFGGFVYVLGRLRGTERSSHEIVNSPAWRRWLLDERQVRAQLLEADREGLLRYADAGSSVRIDWRVDGLEEMVRAVA